VDDTLDARTSTLVTVALSTCTTPSSTFTVMVSPLTAFCGLQLHHVRGHDLAGHDAIREDATELLLVLRFEQRLERVVGQLRKRLVGRREYRERARALQRGREVRQRRGPLRAS